MTSPTDSDSSSVPFPPTGQYIASVRDSCRAARTAANITLSSPAIDAFLTSLNRADFHRLKTQHGLAFPLHFPTRTSEANFLSILALLNTLSGYRLPLRAATGQGAYQNVQKLLLGLYLSGSNDDAATNAIAGSSFLTSRGLAQLSAARVAETLGVSLHEERPHDTIAGLTIGTRGGALTEAVDLLVHLCNHTGTTLLQANYPSLGVFTLETLTHAETLAKSKGPAAGADLFIEKLVRLLPGFNDAHPSPRIYLYKKAFFLLHALSPRFDPILPLFVDNVLPTLLVHLNILDLSTCPLPLLHHWSPSSSSSTPGELQPGPTLPPTEAYTVRAACLDAGSAIVTRARTLAAQNDHLSWLAELNEVDLDGYLWAVAKDDPTLRTVPRMVERNTIMY